MRLKNRLWNPEHQEAKRKKAIKKNHNLDDLICQLCKNREMELPNGDKLPCQNMCYPLTWTEWGRPKKIIVEDIYGNVVDVTPEPQYKCAHCGDFFPASEFGTRGKKVCSMCKNLNK